MDYRRKQYADEIYLNIRIIENAQKRDQEMLKNFQFSQDFLQKKQLIIEKRKNNLSDLEQRKQDFLSGKLDQEIVRELEKNSKICSRPKKKEVEKKEVKKKNIYVEHQERNRQRDYDYYYSLFCKANDLLPNYMRENLANMPNNKGYIWRGCWFLGNKPSELGQPVIIFEKRGGVMYIHEIDKYEHRIFEKIGKEKRRLTSSGRKRIPSGKIRFGKNLKDSGIL